MSRIDDIQELIESFNIEGIETDAPDNLKIGDAPILDNGLNLLYAPQSYGKSYTSIAIAKESGLPAVFIDLESNGKMFSDHCKDNGIAYTYIGSAQDILGTIKELISSLKKQHHKILIIIDSYSDLFPDDEGRMAKDSQKQLGDIHRYFMREVELPILILDHATETPEGKFKIEGNKSGKFKKTVAVLKLDQINNDIENGTFVTVERSRNADELPKGHTQYYFRNNRIKELIESAIANGRLNEKFTSSDLKHIMDGDTHKSWRNSKEDICDFVEKVGRSVYWKLK